MLKTVNIEEAIDLIKKNNDIQLLDTRSDMEVTAPGIRHGSTVVDVTHNPNFAQRLSNLDKEKD